MNTFIKSVTTQSHLYQVKVGKCYSLIERISPKVESSNPSNSLIETEEIGLDHSVAEFVFNSIKLKNSVIIQDDVLLNKPLIETSKANRQMSLGPKYAKTDRKRQLQDFEEYQAEITLGRVSLITSKSGRLTGPGTECFHVCSNTITCKQLFCNTYRMMSYTRVWKALVYLNDALEISPNDMEIKGFIRKAPIWFIPKEKSLTHCTLVTYPIPYRESQSDVEKICLNFAEATMLLEDMKEFEEEHSFIVFFNAIRLVKDIINNLLDKRTLVLKYLLNKQEIRFTQEESSSWINHYHKQNFTDIVEETLHKHDQEKVLTAIQKFKDYYSSLLDSSLLKTIDNKINDMTLTLSIANSNDIKKDKQKLVEDLESYKAYYVMARQEMEQVTKQMLNLKAEIINNYPNLVAQHKSPGVWSYIKRMFRRWKSGNIRVLDSSVDFPLLTRNDNNIISRNELQTINVEKIFKIEDPQPQREELPSSIYGSSLEFSENSNDSNQPFVTFMAKERSKKSKENTQNQSENKENKIIDNNTNILPSINREEKQSLNINKPNPVLLKPIPIRANTIIPKVHNIRDWFVKFPDQSLNNNKKEEFKLQGQDLANVLKLKSSKKEGNNQTFPIIGKNPLECSFGGTGQDNDLLTNSQPYIRENEMKFNFDDMFKSFNAPPKENNHSNHNFRFSSVSRENKNQVTRERSKRTMDIEETEGRKKIKTVNNSSYFSRNQEEKENQGDMSRMI